MKLLFGMTLPLEHCAHYSTQRIAPLWTALADHIDGHLLVTHLDGQEMTVLITDEPIKTYNQAAALTGHTPVEKDFPLSNYATRAREEALNDFRATSGLGPDVMYELYKPTDPESEGVSLSVAYKGGLNLERDQQIRDLAMVPSCGAGSMIGGDGDRDIQFEMPTPQAADEAARRIAELPWITSVIVATQPRIRTYK